MIRATVSEFLLRNFSKTQKTSPIIIKPVMNPPVGPAITLKPPLKPENTGRPVIPHSMYIIIETVPHLPPRTDSVRKIPIVCKVKGMAVGIQIHEEIIKTAVQSAVFTMSFVFMFNSFLINYSLYV